MGGVARHKTATSTAAWDGPANKTRLPNDADALRRANAWGPDGDPKAKSSWKFIHHEVSEDGKVGPANLTACSTGIAVLNGGRGGTQISDSDKRAVYAHLAGHLRDAGREPPELQLSENGITYWADIGGVSLAESEATTWIHALPVGSFKHPVYGTISLTLDRIQRFANNIKTRVLGIDPYVNYDHRERDGRAAGWIKDGEARSDGLWLLVEWTKEAAQSIRDKEYRYISAEYLDQWTNPHDGNTYKDVVKGAALTNVPFLKNLVPVNLSELVNDQKEGEEVDRAELARLLGLASDASDEDIKNKLAELSKAGGQKLDLSKLTFERQEDGTIVVKHPEAEGEATYKVEQPKEKEPSEEELAKLAENNPAIKKLIEDSKHMKSELGVLKTANRLSEIDVQLNELSAEKRALPPVVTDKLKNVLVRLPKELSDEFVDALKELHKVGFVELGERRGHKPIPVESGDVVKQFNDLVEKTREKNDKLSYREAVGIVVRENPELYREYTEAIEANMVSLAEEG